MSQEWNPIPEIRRSVSDGIFGIFGVRPDPGQIHIPAEKAAVSCSCFVMSDRDPADVAAELDRNRDRFPEVRGISPVAGVTERNRWLLFELSDLMYDRAVRTDCGPEAVFPEDDTDSFCFHRMRMLSRYDSSGCPADADVQRAVLLCWVAGDSGREQDRVKAESALLRMVLGRAPKDRQDILRQCGDVARTALRMLY